MKKLTKYVSVVVLSAAFALSTPLNYMESVSYAESLEINESVVKMILPKGKSYNIKLYDITDYYNEFYPSNASLSHSDFVKKLRDNVMLEDLDKFSLYSEYLDMKDQIDVNLDNNKAYLIVDTEDHIVPFVIVGDYELNGEAITIYPKDNPPEVPPITPTPPEETPEKPPKVKEPPVVPRKIVKRSNPKMGVGSSTGLIATLLTGISGLFVSRKKNKNS